MEWIALEHGDVREFGSHQVQMAEAARLQIDGEFRTHLARIAPAGLLGRHPTRLWQLFYVVDGAGWVSDDENQRFDISAGEAVLWSPGENHSSGSDEGMIVVIVQSSVRLPLGC